VEYLPEVWSRSKTFRIILVIASIYALLRLIVHFFYLTQFFPDDLRVYLEAANNLLLRQELYPQGTLTRADSFQYAPSFALAFVPFLWLPRGLVALIQTLLHLGAYGLLYVGWSRIFRRLGLDRANEMLAWTLPVWLVFSQFWGDLGFLNVYIFMALLATWLIDAVLNEHLGWSLLWLSIILQIKPMWAFAVVVPLLLGRYRFFLKLIALAAVVYVAIAGVVILATGPTYGWQQHVDYVRHLASMQGGNFPWRTPDKGFLGYNHSITQIAVYWLGVTPFALRLASGIKVLLLAPLAWVSLRRLLQPIGRAGVDAPQQGLDLAFAFYLGTFIWLDVVWEVTLGIAVFTYLLATLDSHQQVARIVVWGVFLLYALVDFFQLIGVAILGMDAILPGALFVTDPSIYIPLVMIVILTFYALLVKRLWRAPTRQIVSD
jgi:hypothetical protein